MNKSDLAMIAAIVAATQSEQGFCWCDEAAALKLGSELVEVNSAMRNTENQVAVRATPAAILSMQFSIAAQVPVPTPALVVVRKPREPQWTEYTAFMETMPNGTCVDAPNTSILDKALCGAVKEINTKYLINDPSGATRKTKGGGEVVRKVPTRQYKVALVAELNVLRVMRTI